MKKFLLAVLSCLMLLSCCFFIGCGGNAEGEYKVVKINTTRYDDNDNEFVHTTHIGDEWKYNDVLRKDTFVLNMGKNNEGYLRYYFFDGGDEVEDGLLLKVYLFEWVKGYNNEYYCTFKDANTYYDGVEEGGEVFIIKIDGGKACIEYYVRNMGYSEIYLEK